MSDEALLKSHPQTAGVQLAFKYIFAKDFSVYQELVLKALQKAPSGVRKVMLKYIIGRANVEEEILMHGIHKYLPKDGGTAMELYLRNQQRYINIGKDQGFKQGRDQGFKQGKDQGFKQGIGQGFKQGIDQGIERVARTMLKSGASKKNIKNFTGLSDKELEALVD